jgi:hypothetical protein
MDFKANYIASPGSSAWNTAKYQSRVNNKGIWISGGSRAYHSCSQCARVVLRSHTIAFQVVLTD